MTEIERFRAIGTAVLSLVPESDRKSFQEFILSDHQDTYVGMANLLLYMLGTWERAQTADLEMDIGL